MFLEDASAFCADMGRPVIFGSQATLALFDQPDRQIMNGRVQSTGYAIEYPTTDLLGLANGNSVLIGITQGWALDSTGSRLVFLGANPERALSATFKVLGTPNLLDDGLFMRADLERTS